jgi:hypothetical protein
MKKIFDYIFLRWYRIYSGMEISPTASASVMVSFYQTLFIIFLASLYKLLFRVKLASPKYLLVIMVVILIINYLRYERNFDVVDLQTQWREESKSNSKKRMIILIAYLVIMVAFPIIVGLITS